MEMKIALAGNPNCGKTTMFNDLTGSSQYVGNWPGVTVEKKEGRLKGHGDVIITDLPGIYSLSPYTLEEVVTRNYIIGEKPDAVINLVDGSNLERNLYLTTQILEMNEPVVIALNMMDVVKKNGDVIDVQKLSKTLGCEIVETAAVKGTGSRQAAESAIRVAQARQRVTPQRIFNDKVETALERIATLAESQIDPEKSRWYAIKLFERDEKVLAELKLPEGTAKEIEAVIAECEKEFDDDSESIITNGRYEFIGKVVKTCLHKHRQKLSTSDKIDRIVTNRVLALPIFALVMIAVYYIAVTSLGTIVTDWTNDTLFGEWIQPGVASLMTSAGAADWAVSLVVDGIIGGLAAPIGFAPQMAILFFLLSLLEDCGYMARVAFIMDRAFRRFGLSGKSFIPLLISSGCGVPGIMSTRTIENEKDRRMTMITTTMIPCGAKLPVIALIAGAIMGGSWWMAPLMYFVGVTAVIVSCIILKKTKMFSGEPAPFVMEMPQYHIPAIKGVLIHVWERVSNFLIKAGTVLFLCCAVMWFLATFGFTNGSFGMVDTENSLLSAIGGFLAPLFAPLGFGNWQAVASSLSGFVAKEGIVSTMAVLVGLGDATETDASLWTAVMGMFSGSIAAVSFLIFNLLDSPCLAAISTLGREMHDRKWTVFALVYQNVFAYCIALMVYQFGIILTGSASFGVGTAAAIIILVLMLYLLFRKAPDKNSRTLAGQHAQA